MTDTSRLTSALADRYRLLDELGEGGMATVYLAEDLRHDRKVAVKVLRPELAAVIGAERFLSEIKTTANLQHPHILPLFDSGEADGFLFYVMPYVEGETVRDRLTREKQLPVTDAVRIATEVAAALDYAHRHGVIHRDIKPENILLHDGSALVADFGIALAASKAGSTRMTETGMSLGTPHYMSPEQAMGEREITARSDVYALGCVLYEMLTGEPPFTGATAQAIVARVLTEHPRPMLPQRHTIPPQVEAAVLTSLEKLPADRFSTAAEFAAALGDTGYASKSTVSLAAAAGTATALWKRRTAFAAGVAVVALFLAGLGWVRSRPQGDRPTSWQYLALGDSVQLTTLTPGLALSPDGNTLVVKDARQNGRLWVKRAGVLDPVPVPGTERASNPSFSPDGEWILYLADRQLRKVNLANGASVTLADSVSVSTGFGGATWLDDGTIVYVPQDLNRLMRVSANGGTPTTVMDNSGLQGVGFGYPTALPGGRGVLFEGCTSGCVTMSLRVLDLRTGQQKLLMNEATKGWYLPTGHLLYARRDGTLLAAPFNLDRLEVTGTGVPVVQNVFVVFGAPQLAWSATGSLVFASGESQGGENTFVRVGMDGSATAIDSGWSGQFTSFALSPDGRQLAVGSGTGVGALNVWIKQLDRGPFTRISFGGADRRPVWSPDGQMVAFVRDTLTTSVVVGRYADGRRPDSLLVHIDRQVQEVDWSRDGKWLVVRTDNGSAGAGDLVGIRTGGDTTPVPLVASSFTELNPAISPDSRWLAYASNESGQNEIFVRPFPNTGDGRWQVSTNGGFMPRWAPDGKTLYFIEPGSGELMSVPVTTGPTFAAGQARALFGTSGFVIDGFHTSFELTPDGRQFLFTAPHQDNAAAAQPALVRSDNWFRDLEARMKQ
ncbi:MAG TPA: protein kinase [Gemmatimonadales bacterium]|nr:protein kinase [Gemmatimonadales bacterium]